MKSIYIKARNKFIGFLKVGVMILVIVGSGEKGWGQVAGDFRSAATGNWSTSISWQRYNGATWDASGVGANNPGQTPTATSSIFIQSGNIITLTTNSACNDLHIANSTTNVLGARGIVALATFTLEVNGKMRTYYGAIGTTPGTSSTLGFSAYPFSASTGKVSMVGNTRNLTLTGEWSATITTASTGTLPLEINLNAGQITTLATGIKITSLIVNTGTISVGANRIAVDNATTGQGDVIINSNGILMSANTGGAGNSVISRTGTTATGRCGTFTLNGQMILSGASPEIQFTIININSGSTVEFNGTTQNFLSSSFTGAASITTYGNLILSTSNNKTPNGNFTTLNNLTISGSAVLLLSTLTATIGGNWTSYGTAGLTESTSTVNFNGTGTQTINTTGGEDFFKLLKTGIGTLTLNSDVRLGSTSSELNISAGVLDAGTNTLSGTAPTALTMSGGTLKLAKLATTLPEFPITTGYSLTGGTIEFSGAGAQELQGARNYRNLTFSISGTKTLSSAPTSITGTVTVSNAAILDVSNNDMGGVGTNLTMTGTSKYKTAGTGTKPDSRGTYTLAPTSTIEFSNNAGTQQDVRLTPDVGTVTYGNIDISGSNVGLSGATSTLNMQVGTTFTVTSIGTFNVKNTNGFSGSATTAINNTNSPTITLVSGSTINYDGAAQTITNTLGYQNLKFSGTGIKTAPSTDLIINGNLSRTGTHTFNANASRVVFQGTTPQTYSAALGTSPIDFYNLSSINPQNLIVDSTFGILNELNLTSTAKLNLNIGDVVMRSTATRTAYIVDLGTSLASTNITYGTGRFSIERFLFAQKSWRFLATPVVTVAGGDATSPTITEAWREGQAVGTYTATGYGTRITGAEGGSGAPTMDEYTQRGSMKSYDATFSTFTIINTLAEYNNRFANDQGYFVFVRGDRGINVPSGSTGATNLRMKGKIRTGNQTFSIPATKFFNSVGNPYPSRIDFRTVTKDFSINLSYYVWNPVAAGNYNVGKYEVYVRDIAFPNDYKLSVAPFTVKNFIESGEAVFIQDDGTGGSITVKETDKATGSANVSRTGVISPTLEISLHAKDASGNSYLADGVQLNFDNSFNNGLDKLDVKKVNNSFDNLSVKTNTSILAVERRKNLIATDTIFLNLTNTRVAAYRLVIDPSVLSNTGLEAFLKDKFLQTTAPVSLTDVTNIAFDITADAASKAADRFTIVFKQALPAASFIDVKAFTNANKTNAIQWKVNNENKVANYTVERSANGINFTPIKNTAVLQNNNTTVAYSNADATPLKSKNYYRIKMLLLNGNIMYSDVVKVDEINNDISITISPNPVVNKTIRILLHNQPSGMYIMRLLNNAGQVIYNGRAVVSTYLQTENIALDKSTAAGNYRLILVDASGQKTIKKVVIGE